MITLLLILTISLAISAIFIKIDGIPFAPILVSILWGITIILMFIKEYKRLRYKVISKSVRYFNPIVLIAIPPIINGALTFISPGINMFGDKYSYITQSILWFGMGFIYILNGLDRSMVSEYGVFTKDSYHKWKHIDGYKWGDRYSKKLRKGTVEYLELVIFLKSGWISKKILKTEPNRAKVNIPVENRQRVEEFLKNKFGMDVEGGIK